MKKVITLSIVFGVLIMIGIFAANVIGFSNEENTLRVTFTQKMKQRSAFYEKMWKSLEGKSKITLKLDTSFHKMVNEIMINRKDGEQVFMKWVTESNPGVSFTQVAEAYNSLSRTLEAEREGFYVVENTLGDIEKQHTLKITNFPGSFYNIFFNRQPLNYKPISSDRTDDVMRTGKDNKSMIF